MLISIDFETYLISASEPIPRPICLSYYYIENNTEYKGLLVGYKDMESFLTAIIQSTKTQIIAHNSQFELLVIDKHFPQIRKEMYRKLKAKQIICTKIYGQMIDNIRDKQIRKADLATLIYHYFKVDISADKKDPDAWRLRYSELDGIPLKDWPEEAKSYAIDDSIWAYKLYKEQVKEQLDIYGSVSADFYLNKMGLFGLKVDPERVKTLESELKETLKPKYEELKELNLVRREKGVWKKNIKILKELISNNIKKLEKTAKGSISTKAESLKVYLAEESAIKPHIESFLFIMTYEKILSAFVPRLKSAEEADNVIRTSYRAVVSTGRTSSSSSQNYPSLNIQQMPRKVENVTYTVRNCFIPRKGYKICSIDYSGLELASTAHQLYILTGKSSMRDMLNRGEEPTDMHSMFAYKLMNLKNKNNNETYESFVANKKQKPYSDYRQLAKPINLGFPGGIGYDTMRILLANDGVYPKIKILEISKYESSLTWKRRELRKQGYPVRIRRVAFDEYQLIYDELVEIKGELFNLYPDLEYFLSEGHKEFLTGKHKNIKNEFGEWEKEPMYSFEVGDFRRDFCMYTQICNGFLMQSPAAIGAKMMMCSIIEKYSNSDICHPLAFIHDEIVFEVKEHYAKAIAADIAEIMIDDMHKILPSVRITVEAELMDYWMKSGGYWSKSYWKNTEEDTLYEI